MEFTEENFQKLEKENQQLKQRLDWLLRRMFGRSSEKVDPNQLRLDFGSEVSAVG